MVEQPGLGLHFLWMLPIVFLLFVAGVTGLVIWAVRSSGRPAYPVGPPAMQMGAPRAVTVEGGADLLALAPDRIGPGRLDAVDEVVDLQHLDVRAGLGVHLREVGIHVEHSRIGVTQEADPCGPQAVRGVGRVQPFA